MTNKEYNLLILALLRDTVEDYPDVLFSSLVDTLDLPTWEDYKPDEELFNLDKRNLLKYYPVRNKL